MAYKIVNDDSLTSVANAIRVQGSISGTLEFPDGFVSAIQNLSPSPTIEALSVTQNGVYSAPSGVDGYSPVTVNVSGGGGSDVEDAIVNRGISGAYYNDRVENVGMYAFIGCNKLTGATFPNALVIGSSAFSGCSALATISFPSVSLIQPYAFSGCYNLETASFPLASNIQIYAFNRCSALTAISFPSARALGASVFNGCSNLTVANFPVAATAPAYGFYSCVKLETALFQTASLIYSYAFAGCVALTDISFPEAKSIYNFAFRGCSNLSTASFPKVSIISSNAFRNCSKLMSLYMLSSSAATLGTSAFLDTPMSNSTYTGSFGSIYVPASLVDTYKTRANWSAYADRITAYEG